MAGMFGFGVAAWGLFFSITGAWALIAAQTSDTIGPDGELGGTIVGITFLVMGLPALAFAAWSGIQSLGERDERPSMGDTAAGTSVGGIGQMLSGLRTAQSQGGFGSAHRWGSGGGTATASSSGDSIARLERLQRLRESGALTDAEFERDKAKILSGS